MGEGHDSDSSVVTDHSHGRTPTPSSAAAAAAAVRKAARAEEAAGVLRASSGLSQTSEEDSTRARAPGGVAAASGAAASSAGGHAKHPVPKSEASNTKRGEVGAKDGASSGSRSPPTKAKLKRLMTKHVVTRWYR